MTKRIISTSLVAVGFFLGASALSVFGAWTAPLSAPPACTSGNPGCDAPINVGNISQSKLGSLKVNTAIPQSTYGLDVWGLSRFYGDVQIGDSTTAGSIQITDGNQGAGKVLTSDAAGKASWQDISSASAGDPSGFVIPNHDSWNDLGSGWTIIHIGGVYNNSSASPSDNGPAGGFVWKSAGVWHALLQAASAPPVLKDLSAGTQYCSASANQAESGATHVTYDWCVKLSPSGNPMILQGSYVSLYYLRIK
jgi:hypothetical protein